MLSPHLIENRHVRFPRQAIPDSVIIKHGPVEKSPNLEIGVFLLAFVRSLQELFAVCLVPGSVEGNHFLQRVIVFSDFGESSCV